MSSNLKLEENNFVLQVKLNRPEKHNSFHPAMIQELTMLFKGLASRSDLRVVVLSGEGKSFSAGGDLEWMKSMAQFTFEENQQDARRLADMYQAMLDCPLPLVARVHGHVMGGGLGLVAVSDVVIADERVQFCFSEAKIGIAPAVIAPFVLRKANLGLVREVMLSARIFSASEAQAMGLVHQVCRDVASGLEHEKKMVDQFLQCGPEAVREAKKLIDYIYLSDWSAQRERSTQVIAERRASVEGQEGLKGFLEKRAPKWRAN